MAGTVSSPPGQTNGATVLYVEDDAPSAHLAELVLRRAGLRVLRASSGERGLELAGRERPDLVPLDPGLPDLDGREMIGRLRRMLGGSLPVVVVTGDTRPEHVSALREAGASDCLAKPLDPARVLELVSGRAQLSTCGGPETVPAAD